MQRQFRAPSAGLDQVQDLLTEVGGVSSWACDLLVGARDSTTAHRGSPRQTICLDTPTSISRDEIGLTPE